MRSRTRRKLALIIGNDHYSQPINQLNQSVNNAQQLAFLLESIQFQVKLEIDVRKDIMRQIQAFTIDYTIANGDLVLFYFSGHACQHNGENWLIPTEDSHIDDMDALQSLGVNVSGILNRLLDSTNRSCTVICILDCCKPYSVGTGSVPNKRRRSGAFIQFACNANETTNRNLFSEHLLRRITAENKDVVEIFREISNAVDDESNHTQKPFFINGLQDVEKVYLHETTNLPVIPENAVWRRKAVTVVGGAGHGKTLDRLHSPKGLCIDRNQNILIADSSDYRFMKFEQKQRRRPRTGRIKSSYRLNMLYQPLDIILSTDQTKIIISDCHNLRTLKSTLNNRKCITTVLNSYDCFALAIADDGTIYVSDTRLNEVRRYRPNKRRGTVVAGGNGRGSRLNQLNYPTYICIGRNRSIYISDSWNDRVMKWDEGAQVGVIVAGGHGKGNGLNQLDCPTGIIVDSLGTVYVADSNNGRVMRWRQGASRGDIIVGDRFRIGDARRELNGPEDIAVDQYNNLYVADSNNHRIQRFRIEQT